MAEVTIREAILAGWSGRYRASVQKHVDEMAAIGVPRPASVPVFYRCSATRLTTAEEIQVVGEVEFVLIKTEGALWVGTGSDQTDRKVESYGITVSKQLCDKPIAPELWLYSELKPHWDELILRGRVITDGKKELYQQSAGSAIMPPAALIRQYTNTDAMAEGWAMFSGTLPAIGGIRPSQRFAFELEDPVLGRSLRHEYTIHTLPIVG
jgi:hypothetical protein